MQGAFEFRGASAPVEGAIGRHEDVGVTLAKILSVLARIEKRLDLVPLRDQEWFTVAEIARMLNKKQFTVQEWCRLGRINASKRANKRGPHRQGRISAREVQRIREEGLLPDDKSRNR